MTDPHHHRGQGHRDRDQHGRNPKTDAVTPAPSPPRPPRRRRRGAAGPRRRRALPRPARQSPLTPVAPVAVSALTPPAPIRRQGRGRRDFGNKFILQDGTGRALVETGRAGEGGTLVAKGESVTVQGRFENGFLHASALTRADGKIESYAPWAATRRPRLARTRSGSGERGRPGPHKGGHGCRLLGRARRRPRPAPPRRGGEGAGRQGAGRSMSASTGRSGRSGCSESSRRARLDEVGPASLRRAVRGKVWRELFLSRGRGEGCETP